MIVQVNIEYALLVPTYALVQINADAPIQFELDGPQQALMAAAVAALQAEDVTNKGWLIESDRFADSITITLYSNTIDPEVTTADKGANAFEESPVYADLTAIVEPILDAVIPTVYFSADSGNITGYVYIKKLDATNFEVGFVIKDILDTVAFGHIVFVDFTGPAPIPTEYDNIEPVLIAEGIKKFSVSTLNFENPILAVGETYPINLGFRNSGMSEYANAASEAIVQDI